MSSWVVLGFKIGLGFEIYTYLTLSYPKLVYIKGPNFEPKNAMYSF